MRKSHLAPSDTTVPVSNTSRGEPWQPPSLLLTVAEAADSTRAYQLRSFASAFVHCGRDPQALRSLADLVALDAFNDGLRFYYERRGKQSSSAIHDMP